VNAGLTTTTAGQVTVAAADPRSLVAVSSSRSCAAGGIYKIPAGKALIVTGVDFLTAGVTSDAHYLALAAGPAATPCTNLVAAATEKTEQVVSQNQIFSPGIPVPAGDAIGLVGFNDNVVAIFYGYLVPAAAVPANALKNARAGVLGGLAAGTPPR
jgi:hypothetical protein